MQRPKWVNEDDTRSLAEKLEGEMERREAQQGKCYRKKKRKRNPRKTQEMRRRKRKKLTRKMRMPHDDPLQIARQ